MGESDHGRLELPSVPDHQSAVPAIEPRIQGKIAAATHIGKMGDPGDGPYIVIALTIKGRLINDAKYQCHGCPTAIVCSSVVCQIAKGRLADNLYGLTAGDIARVTGYLPAGKEHMAEMAAEAFRQALDPVRGMVER